MECNPMHTKLIKSLRRIAQRDLSGVVLNLGLCYNCIYSNLRRTEDYCITFMRTWEYYSGDIEYPVPHAAGDPKAAYYMYANLYDTATLYGSMRLDLARHLADELEKLDESTPDSSQRAGNNFT